MQFFSVGFYRENEQSYQFLEKSDRKKCIFWKSSDMTSYPKKWWRHNSAKNVSIDLNFCIRTFIVKMNNHPNFYKSRNRGSLFLELFCIVLLYYTRLWDNGGVYYRTFRGHVTPYPQCFSSFFSPKVRKTNFHNISNRFFL